MSQQALTQSHLPDQTYRFHRPTTLKDRQPVPLRWRTVLALHLSGKKPKEVMEATGYSSAMYYRILRHPLVEGMRQQLLADTQRDFEALYPKVVENLRQQLDEVDPKIQLEAQNQWFRASGKFAPKKEEAGGQVTAEALVQQLLNQTVNVNVNLGGQAAPPPTIDVTPSGEK